MNAANPLFSQDVLDGLCEQHRLFERLFVAIESACAQMQTSKALDVARLEAMRWYLSGEGRRHHEIEDRIFTVLLARLPQFSEDIYDLRDDHEQSGLEFSAFARTLDALKADDTPQSREAFCDSAEAYIANERGHFISEEELFFPYAVRNLSSDDWAALASAPALPTTPDQACNHCAALIAEILKQN